MRILADRYSLGERHGGGGMGAVFTAEDTRLNRQVAVKVMQDSLASDPRFVERFRREARAAASLSHPNIATVFDYGEDDATRYIVMELVEGRDLAQLLREEGPLEPERAKNIAHQIAAALGHAHERGVVHRDVKPGNVLVGPDDRVKVTDFGIARAIGDSTLTASGVIMGSVHYISPEQAAGTATKPASDVYSLGIVLYEMLTGSVPFTADSAVGVAMRHLDDEVPAPSDLDPSIPSEIDEIVKVATAKAPEKRFKDGNEMAGALSSGTAPAPMVAAATAPAAAATVPYQAGGGTQVLTGQWDPVRVGRTVLMVLAALAIVALVLALIRVSQGGEDTAPRRAQQQEETTSPPAEESPVEEAAEVPTYTLPSMVGDSFKDWEKVLKDAGLEVEEIEIDNEAEKDTILAMSPEEGSTVSPGDTVTLTISSGKEEDEGPPEGRGKGKGKDDD